MRVGFSYSPLWSLECVFSAESAGFLYAERTGDDEQAQPQFLKAVALIYEVLDTPSVIVASVASNLGAETESVLDPMAHFFAPGFE